MLVVHEGLTKVLMHHHSFAQGTPRHCMALKVGSSWVMKNLVFAVLVRKTWYLQSLLGSFWLFLIPYRVLSGHQMG